MSNDNILDNIKQLAILDTANGKKIRISIKDTESNEAIPPAEFAKDIVEYLLKETGPHQQTELRDRIQPLAQFLLIDILSAMSEQGIISDKNAALSLLSDPFAALLVDFTLIGFILNALLRQKQIGLELTNEDLPPEELQELRELNKIASIFLLATNAGENPQKTFDLLIESGELTQTSIDRFYALANEYHKTKLS
jgi:hypothetical protein